MYNALDTTFVPKIYEYFTTSLYCHMVFEQSKGKNVLLYLTDNVSSCSEDEFSKIVQQILSVIRLLHSIGVMMRTLCPEYIFYDGQQISMIDLGMCSLVKDAKKNRKMLVGNPEFRAPECFDGKITEKADIWSVGIFLFSLLAGRTPFEGSTDTLVHDNMLARKINVDYQLIPRVSDNGLSFLKMLLEVDPKKRPDADTMLKHPWISKKNSTDSIKNVTIEQLSSALANFGFKNELQQMLYLLFISNMDTSKESHEIKKAFLECDTDKNGQISLEEFEVFIKILAKHRKDIDVSKFEELFNEIDMDQSGSISYLEFHAAMLDKKSVLTEENIEKFFKILDPVI